MRRNMIHHIQTENRWTRLRGRKMLSHAECSTRSQLAQFCRLERAKCRDLIAPKRPPSSTVARHAPS
jgi:hypothetical protein